MRHPSYLLGWHSVSSKLPSRRFSARASRLLSGMRVTLVTAALLSSIIIVINNYIIIDSPCQNLLSCIALASSMTKPSKNFLQLFRVPLSPLHLLERRYRYPQLAEVNRR